MERDKETPDDYANHYGSVKGHEVKQSNFQICQYQFFNISNIVSHCRINRNWTLLL